jgi:hypothetical protein
VSLDRAIEQLQAEVTAYGQGTLTQPLPDTTEWFLLRAKTLGLSSLKRMRQLGVELDSSAAERYYRKSSKAVKAEEPGPPQEVVIGTL